MTRYNPPYMAKRKTRNKQPPAPATTGWTRTDTFLAGVGLLAAAVFLLSVAQLQGYLPTWCWAIEKAFEERVCD